MVWMVGNLVVDGIPLARSTLGEVGGFTANMNCIHISSVVVGQLYIETTRENTLVLLHTRRRGEISL